MRLSWVWPLLVLLFTGVTGAIIFKAPDLPMRPQVVIGFLCLCPGMALVRYFRFDDLIIELTLAFVLSFSIDAIVTGIFMYSRHWSPSLIMDTLLLFSFSCAFVKLVTPRLAVDLRVRAEQSQINREVMASEETRRMAMMMVPVPVNVGKNVADVQTLYLPRLASPEPIKKDVSSVPVTQGEWEKEETRLISRSIRERAASKKEAMERQATQNLPDTPAIFAGAKEDIAEEETRLISRSTLNRGMEKVRAEKSEAQSVPHIPATPKQQKEAIANRETLHMPSTPVPIDKQKEAIADRETVHVPSVPISLQENKAEIENKPTQNLPDPHQDSASKAKKKVEEQETLYMPGTPVPSQESKEEIEDKPTQNLPDPHMEAKKQQKEQALPHLPNTPALSEPREEQGEEKEKDGLSDTDPALPAVKRKGFKKTRLTN